MHENQILHHNPSFKLFMLYNSFDNQGSKINKDDIFFFFYVPAYANFCPITHATNLHLDIALLAFVLDFARN